MHSFSVNDPGYSSGTLGCEINGKLLNSKTERSLCVKHVFMNVCLDT